MVEICRRFPDHHWFEQSELEEFYDRCADRAMDMIVTTEKDAVRLEKPEEDPEVPIYFLRIEVEIYQGQEAWNRCVDRICGISEPRPRTNGLPPHPFEKTSVSPADRKFHLLHAGKPA